MSYLSQDELVTKFGQEEVEQATYGLESEAAAAKVAAAINSAEAVVNSHLGARGYSLPVDATALVKDTVADIARYKLFDNRASQQIRENYEDAIKFLEKIVAGKAETCWSKRG